MDSYETCGEWISAATLPRPYHCTPLAPWWSGTCMKKYGDAAPARYAHLKHDLRLQPCGQNANGLNATRIVELLANRTVAIVGSSVAANFWCALLCYLVRSATNATLEPAIVHGATGLRVARMRSAVGTVDWVEPPPPDRSPLEIIPRLVSHASKVHDRIVIVAGCRGEYEHRSPLLATAQSALQSSREPMKLLRSWPELKRELCQRSSSGCKPGTATWIASHYEDKCAKQAKLLRQLNEEGPLSSLGALLETAPIHFPDAPYLINGGMPASVNATDDGLDDPGSYERFYLSALSFIHRHAKQNATALFEAMQISRPVVSSYAPQHGHMDPAYIIGFAQSDAARACRLATGSSLDDCYLQALLKVGGPTERRSHFRLRSCQPIETGRSEAVELGWRQRVEARVAGAFRLPMVLRHQMRLMRWDLHPGLTRAEYTNPIAKFDCLHSLRGDGAFDAELFSLSRVLEARFGKK